MNIAVGSNPVLDFQAAGIAPSRLRGGVSINAGSSGTVGQHIIFGIAGAVAFRFFAICETPLTSGGAATISFGNAGAVADLGAATLATTIDAGDVLCPASTTFIEAAGFSAYDAGGWKIAHSTDITSNILVTTITGGYMIYTLQYYLLANTSAVTLSFELTEG